MRAYMLFFAALIVGCGVNQNDGSHIDNHVLSITPEENYIARVEQAAPVSYSKNIILVQGLVGNFRLVLENHSDQRLTDVQVIGIVNDPTMLSEITFGRIYHTVFWGNNIFVFQDVPTLPDGTAFFNNDSQYSPLHGSYAMFEGDTLEPYSSTRFDNIVLANPGMELYFTMYASMPDGTHYAMPLNATSVKWEY